MQKVEINGVDSHPLERGFAAAQDVVGRRIVAIGRVRCGIALEPDPALGGDDHAIAHAAHGSQGVSEDFLGTAATEAVGQVEKIDTSFVGGDDGCLAGPPFFRGDGGGVYGAGDAPATISQARNTQFTAAERHGGLRVGWGHG